MSTTVLKREIIRQEDIHVYLSELDARLNFNNNIVPVDGEYNTYLYYDEGNLSTDVDYTILLRQKNKVINALIKEELVCFTRAELSQMDTETVYEHLSSIYGVHGSNSDIEGFLSTCKQYNIQLKRDNYIEIEVIGHSQGERATVLINKAEALKVWGCKDINESDLRTLFTNYFYDIPAMVRIDILGTEYISDRFDGRCQNYQDKDNYDKDEFIIELKAFFEKNIKDLEYFEKQLKELLPSKLQWRIINEWSKKRGTKDEKGNP